MSQTLHTATRSILSSLLLFHLSCEEPTATYTLTRRVLTAAIHHVNSADQFETLGDILVGQFTAVADATVYDEERLRRILEIIAVPCAVRHGSRLSGSLAAFSIPLLWISLFFYDSEKQLSVLASRFPSLPVTEVLHNALLKVAASVLMASNMTLWTGLGRKMIDRCWEYLDLGIELCGALADLGWGGWKVVALPNVLKLTPQLLQNHPKTTVQLLAALYREKKLGEVDLVWRQRLETWARGRLTKWERSEDTVSRYWSPLGAGLTILGRPWSSRIS